MGLVIAGTGTSPSVRTVVVERSAHREELNATMANTTPQQGPALYREPPWLTEVRAVLLGVAASQDAGVEAQLAALEALDVLRVVVPARTVPPEVTPRPGGLESAWRLLDEAAGREPRPHARVPLSIAAGCVRRALRDH